MAHLNKGKHIVEEIDGVRCTIIEKNITIDRKDFLKDLLEFNNYEVLVREEVSPDDGEKLYSLGVTDIIFNPVIAIYEKGIKNRAGYFVTPAFWNQYTDKINYQYWRFTKNRPTKQYIY